MYICALQVHYECASVYIATHSPNSTCMCIILRVPTLNELLIPPSLLPIFFLCLLQSSQASDMLWFLTARTLLKESHIMQFCRRTLCAIVEKPRCIEAVEVGQHN